MLIFDADTQDACLDQLFAATAAELTLPAYEPVNDKVAEFHRRPEKIRLLLGGNQSGKTHSTTYEVVNRCRTRPGTVAWACTESYNMVGEALFPKYEMLIHPDEISKIAWANRARNIPAVLWWKNESHITFKSYDQGRRRFQAARVDIIQLDEEPPYNIYMECLARTSATNGQIIFSMTPLMGKTYVYHDLYLQAAESEHIWCETISYLENRFVPEEEKRTLVALYGSDETDRRVYGLFTQLEGAVWKELNLSVNVIPRFPIPRAWRKIRSIDFGYANPFVCLWGAINPDNEIYIYQEYYQSETLLKDHVEAIRLYDTMGLDEDAHHDVGIEHTVADHDAQDRAELERYGLGTLPADKAIVEGLQVVNRCLKPNANGRPSLYWFDDLPALNQEALSYRYKPGTELPLKIDDHTQDALRYLVMHVVKHFSRRPAVLISPPNPHPLPPTTLPALISPPAAQKRPRWQRLSAH